MVVASGKSILKLRDAISVRGTAAAKAAASTPPRRSGQAPPRA
jgi:hypothetical protein